MEVVQGGLLASTIKFTIREDRAAGVLVERQASATMQNKADGNIIGRSLSVTVGADRMKGEVG